MNKLAKIINELNPVELKLMQKDLKEGNITKLISTRIKQLEEGAETICPTCHTGIISPDDEGFTLTFGPKDFRKKATFCATDCLTYFLDNINTINKKRLKEEERDDTIRDYQNI